MKKLQSQLQLNIAKFNLRLLYLKWNLIQHIEKVCFELKFYKIIHLHNYVLHTRQFSKIRDRIMFDIQKLYLLNPEAFKYIYMKFYQDNRTQNIKLNFPNFPSYIHERSFFWLYCLWSLILRIFIINLGNN